MMGMRTAGSMLLGCSSISRSSALDDRIGEILPRSGSVAAGDAVFGRVHVVNTWSLWWGISIMVVASLVALFARPEVFVQAYRSLTGRGSAQNTDVLGHIELPLWVSWVGIPLVGAIGVWMAHAWFGVHYAFGALAIPLIAVLALIAASSTALTSITPSGPLSKVPQFLFGALDPTLRPPIDDGRHVLRMASNASNLRWTSKRATCSAQAAPAGVGHLSASWREQQPRLRSTTAVPVELPQGAKPVVRRGGRTVHFPAALQ